MVCAAVTKESHFHAGKIQKPLKPWPAYADLCDVIVGRRLFVGVEVQTFFFVERKSTPQLSTSIWRTEARTTAGGGEWSVRETGFICVMITFDESLHTVCGPVYDLVYLAKTTVIKYLTSSLFFLVQAKRRCMMQEEWRKGSCHCKAVRFEALIPAVVDVYRCNCSICWMKQNHHFVVPANKFRFGNWKPGEENEGVSDAETAYRFNTQVAKHAFCKKCGVSAV